MNSPFPRFFDPEPGDEACCRGCDACCRWEGTVVFSPESLPALARWLEMDERECAETYFELTPDRRHLRAVETGDGRCPFLGEGGCRIYPLRPPACRSFPYRWQRPETELMRQCRLWRTLLWRAERRKKRARP